MARACRNRNEVEKLSEKSQKRNGDVKMNIKVIGAGCENCDKLYDNVKNAVKEIGCEATVEKVEDLLEIVKLGVMTAPSLMIDRKLVVSGRVAKKEEIIRLIK